MAKRPFEELLELLQREFEDRLQVVLRLDPHGRERLFVRGDLAPRTDDELVEPFVRGFSRDDPDELLPDGPGGPDCLVSFYDHSVELLLYPRPNEAVAIAFDRADDRTLGAFVDRCLSVMR